MKRAFGFGGERGVESVFRRTDFRGVGDVYAGSGADFGADDVRREAGAQEASVERGKPAPIERAVQMREPALQPRANQAGFVGFGEDRLDGGFDMAAGDATRPELTCDAEASLAAGLRVGARVIESVARVVEISALAQLGNDPRHEIGVVRAAGEVIAHFMNRVRAAHQRAQGRGVEFFLGFEFAGG